MRLSRTLGRLLGRPPAELTLEKARLRIVLDRRLDRVTPPEVLRMVLRADSPTGNARHGTPDAHTLPTPETAGELKDAVLQQCGTHKVLGDLDALLAALLQQVAPSVAWDWFYGNNSYLQARPIDVLILEGTGRVREAVHALEQGAY